MKYYNFSQFIEGSTSYFLNNILELFYVLLFALFIGWIAHLIYSRIKRKKVFILLIVGIVGFFMLLFYFAISPNIEKAPPIITSFIIYISAQVLIGLGPKVKKRAFFSVLLIVIFLFLGIGTDYLFKDIIEKQEHSNGRIMANVSQLRTEAEFIYSRDGSYNNFKYKPGGNSRIDRMGDDINSLGGALTITNSDQEYCIYTPLVNVRKWFCVDSSGRSLITTINPSISGYCDKINNFRCPPPARE